VEIGESLFMNGEPSDPALLLRQYQLHKWAKAALALAVRLVALRSAKIDDDKKH
jgi:hypothetical protein